MGRNTSTPPPLWPTIPRWVIICSRRRALATEQRWKQSRGIKRRQRHQCLTQLQRLYVNYRPCRFGLIRSRVRVGAGFSGHGLIGRRPQPPWANTDGTCGTPRKLIRETTRGRQTAYRKPHGHRTGAHGRALAHCTRHTHYIPAAGSLAAWPLGPGPLEKPLLFGGAHRDRASHLAKTPPQVPLEAPPKGATTQRDHPPAPCHITAPICWEHAERDAQNTAARELRWPACLHI